MFWKKKERLIARVYKANGKPTSLTVRTTVGNEVVTGVKSIVERNGYLIFSSQNGGGCLVRVEHFISAFPYD